jgi:hypothetical protein
MNHFIPKYSFIKLFLPHVTKYNSEIYINNHIKKYSEMFTLNDMNIYMNILFREDYVDCHKIPTTNSYFIKTHIQLFLQNTKIEESIQINHCTNHFKIIYELKNNDKSVEKIDIPKFKIENNNYKMFLNNHKFLDKDHYKLFLDIQKK